MNVIRIFCFWLLVCSVTVGEEIFTVPERIRDDVDFWAKVYREWDNNQVVFYDDKTKTVYHVLSLPTVANEISAPRFKARVSDRFDEVADVLSQISISGGDLFPETEVGKSIHETLKKHGMLKETDLAKRLRNQSGLRGQFEAGLKTSGRYADEMQAVLKVQNLPETLLALVFVESLFYLSAESSAGASGPWGIVKETALRSGIQVNRFTDERIDPVISTWGASQFLKKAKDNLTEWPLVITAYNYGFPGMLRAVNNLKSKEFTVILDNHDSPMFGYASKSYYAEFLAALDTYERRQEFFPSVSVEPLWQYELVQIRRPVDVADLYAVNAIKREDLMRLNPGLTKRTIEGHEVIPSSYNLRIPKGKSKHFYSQVKKIPNHKRVKAASKVSLKYVARGKETLYSIAKNHGISSEFLSKRMDKPLNYQPKGSVLIRSQAYLFSPLEEIGKQIMSALSPVIKKVEKEARSK